MPEKPTVKIVIRLTSSELENLKKLSEYRKQSITDCIRGFARTCQPGGSGWRPPYEGNKVGPSR